MGNLHRRALLALAALTLSACATAPVPTSAPLRPDPAQVLVIPPARTVALPARNPPSIVQSQLERMPTAEVARWALPEHAERIVRVEFMKVWMPVIRYGGFFERPGGGGAPGVCNVFVHGVNFRPYRESEQTYAQHLDPPLEPYQVTDHYRYKVIGSTLTGDAATEAACAAALPYNDWFEAPSVQGVYLAVNTIQRAAAFPRQYQITCADERYNTTTQAAEPFACNGADMLEKFTPNLIKRVQGIACEAGFATGYNPCFEVTFDDPKAPGTHSQYVVKTGAKRIAIQHVLLPPM